MSETSKKLRDHVEKRGGPKLENGVWQLMLDAADEIEEMESALRVERDNVRSLWPYGPEGGPCSEIHLPPEGD